MLKLRESSGRLWLAGLASVLPLLGLTTQAQSTMTNGLVAYWNFDASDFKDSVGTFDGTPNGTDPIVFVAGKPGFGQAIQLNGTDQFVEITGVADPDALAFPGGSISIAGWFTVGAFDKSWQALIAKGEGSNWRVHRRGGEVSMSYAGGVGEGLDDGPDVTDGNWHHFVAVSDPNAASFGTAIYIDGVQTSVNANPPTLAANGKNVKIGDNPDATGRYWNGKIDDVGIWNRVLTEAEISALYAGGAGKEIKSFFGPPVFAISAPIGSTAGFTIAVFDAPPVLADTNTIVLKFNGAPVTPTSVTKTAGVTTIAYNVPNPPLASKSTNTTNLTIKDTTGAVHSSDGSFVVAVYITLDPSFALSPADATAAKAHPGFYVQLVATDLTGQNLPNSNARSEYQLAGDLGPNVADLAAGGYTDNSQLIPNLLYESATVDYAMGAVPGIPSLAKGSANYLAAPTDNFSMAFFTAIQFNAAGLYTLGVNSDDGFRAYAGTNLVDRFQQGSIMLGEFNGGRGTADTTYTFNILQPGLYPFRVTYEEGGGGYAVHLFSRNPDRTKSVLNDSADPNALKAFRWIAQQRAYIKSVTPGANVPFGNAYAPNSYLTNGVTIVVGDGSLTKYVSGSAKMQWDGRDVTSSLTSSSAGGLTTIKYNPGLLVRATQHSVRFTYDETSTPVSTRTNDFVINIGPPQMSDLPANSFWIEAEDFDTKGQPVAAASTMPYAGGAYDSMPATFGIDYNNNDAFQTAGLYRDFATPDLVTSGKSIDIVNNLGGQWGTDRPGAAEMTVNYRIGWADSGEWYDYTRTIPAGVYGAYAGLSYGDFSANNMGGKLSIVTAGAGTANQTIQDVGQFDSDGSGGWGQNSLVPMHSLAAGPRTPGYVKLPGGKTTLRFTVRSGDYDFFILTPVTGIIPPVLSSTPSALASIRRDAQLAFTINDYSTSVATSSVKLTVDGQDVTSASTISKPADITSVTYKPTAMFNAGVHSYGITFADNGTPVNSQTVTNIFHVNPYPTPGTFVIEAEDFDYNGGSANPRGGTTGFDVNTMPYYAGAYSNLDAVLNVDYNNDDGQDSQVYRTNLLAHTGHNVDITGNVGGRWGADRGTWTLTNNFRIGWVGTPDWANYTRTFPSNTYQVWAALSHGDAAGTPHDMRGSLDLVTAGVGTTNQTLQPLGIFDAPASGAWGDNELVPITNTNGVLQTVQMSGKQTVRFNMDSGDFDYFLFVPALPGAQRPVFAPPVFVSAGSLRLQWTGSGTLQQTDSLSPPNWLPAPSQANPQNVPTTTGSKYYRIAQ